MIEDQDDAPLVLDNVQAEHVRQTIYVAAEAGSYVLLAGNAQLQAPSYELQAARETVLAVSANDAKPSALTKNPEYRVSLSGSEQGLHCALWGIIALAVLVLGGLTLRLAKDNQ